MKHHVEDETCDCAACVDDIERCDGCSVPIGWDALDRGFCDCGLSCVFADRAARLPVDPAFDALMARLLETLSARAA